MRLNYSIPLARARIRILSLWRLARAIVKQQRRYESSNRFAIESFDPSAEFFERHLSKNSVRTNTRNREFATQLRNLLSVYGDAV